MHAPYFNGKAISPEQAPVAQQGSGRRVRKNGRGRYSYLRLSPHGRLPDDEQQLALSRRKKPQVILQLPPGLCLLRRLQVQGLATKEIQPALQLWAEESLPLAPQQYYLDSWKINDDWYALAALPREPLQRAREQLALRSTKVVRLQVAELTPPRDARSGVVLWRTDAGWLGCFWEAGVLYDWQSFPAVLAPQVILAQLEAGWHSTPAWVALPEDDNPATGTALRTALQSQWPEVSLLPPPEPASTHRVLRRTATQPAFDSYINEERYQAATASDKWRLLLALLGLIAAGLLLLFSEVQQMEKQLEILRHHDSLLKVQASRSGQVAARSGQTLRQIRELRAMTIERSGVMTLLKALGDLLPPTVRLESLGFERNGVATMAGLAESEVDISTFLQRLGQSSLFRNPDLTFTQKDISHTDHEAADGQDETKAPPPALIRFQLEVSLEQALFTAPAATAEAADADAEADAEADNGAAAEDGG